MEAILQKRLGALPPGFGRLPGTVPMAPETWLVVDDAHAAQMSARARLLHARRGEVVAMEPGAEAASREMLELVLGHLRGRSEWRFEGRQVICPDGRAVEPDGNDPLGTLGRLAAEDFCLMVPRGGVHVLAAAVLCFPSRWALAEKLGRAMLRIHAPVPSYGEDLNARVERMMTHLKPGRPLWRANGHFHSDPTLFRPRPEVAAKEWEGEARYFRSERQALLRLEGSGAVVFSIHTTVVDAADLTGEQRQMIAAARGRAEA